MNIKSCNCISYVHLVNCLWSVWKESDCSSSCGPEAFRTKSRTVIRQAENGGTCKGKNQEIESCNLARCPTRMTYYEQ